MPARVNESVSARDVLCFFGDRDSCDLTILVDSHERSKAVVVERDSRRGVQARSSMSFGLATLRLQLLTWREAGVNGPLAPVLKQDQGVEVCGKRSGDETTARSESECLALLVSASSQQLQGEIKFSVFRPNKGDGAA